MPALRGAEDGLYSDAAVPHGACAYWKPAKSPAGVACPSAAACSCSASSSAGGRFVATAWDRNGSGTLFCATDGRPAAQRRERVSRGRVAAEGASPTYVHRDGRGDAAGEDHALLHGGVGRRARVLERHRDGRGTAVH